MVAVACMDRGSAVPVAIAAVWAPAGPMWNACLMEAYETAQLSRELVVVQAHVFAAVAVAVGAGGV